MNELLLLSGSDIPFPEARVTIHQPTLKEIGYIGEKTFFIGTQEKFLEFGSSIIGEIDLFVIDEAYKLQESIRNQRAYK